MTFVVAAASLGLQTVTGAAFAQSPQLTGQAEYREQETRLRRPSQSVPSRLSPGQPFNLNAERFHIQTEEDNQKLESLVPSPGTAFPTNLNGRVTAIPPVAPPRLKPGFPTMDGSRPPFNLNAQQSGLMDSVQGGPPLRGNVSVDLLAKFDVELIVDESLSMMKTDCPGGLSRWDWCGVQARNLSQLLAPHVPNGLTLSTFASNYRVYENSKPKDIIDLFATPFFHGGTRLSRPLQDRLGTYFRNRKPGSKPMLICVITDGVPAPRVEPYNVADTLIAATKQMRNPHEVTVVFFQIGGNDRRGKEFLAQMDHQLTGYGAKYDFVKSVSFEQLMREGLAQSMVNSVRDFGRQLN